MRFVSVSTYSPAHSVGESTDLPSMTMPDQSMSVQELLDRSLHGHSIPTSEGVYDSDFDLDLPDLRSMDLVDIYEMRNQVAVDIAGMRSRLSQRQSAISRVNQVVAEKEVVEARSSESKEVGHAD